MTTSGDNSARGSIFTLAIPVAVAGTGNAVAAGAAPLLTADRRVGADGDFTIGFNEAAVGLPLPEALLMLARDRLRKEVFDEATTIVKRMPRRTRLACTGIESLGCTAAQCAT
ncbi:hypothetical protein A5724_19475 [Mycobacterium sp. ACS1612]|uniref:hypothetical protein n=1 Tax=Mycobacterium sp. ACS1612 TaxID=1834117 RepID=UPI000800D25F|nr:hypothetical protein [Mycobacterium sp. ACS1612]OBF33254.1 hypothetical protein A5724_19475 [Mycobacterium sp. ACS1612]